MTTALTQKLKTFINTIDFEIRVGIPKVNYPNLFTLEERRLLLSQTNGFKHRVALINIIKKKTEKSYSNQKLNFWIINKWGGIQGYKKNEENILKIAKFAIQLKTKKMSRDNFKTISSLSKLPSFIDPDNFVIYDSRVIYAINWLILTTKSKAIKFFPMPSGRNKKMNDFDMNTIIHLINLKKYQNDDIFIEDEKAYFVFCDLMKDLSKKLFGRDAKPYLLEILLFAVSNEEILNEVKGMTTIKVKSNPQF